MLLFIWHFRILAATDGTGARSSWIINKKAVVHDLIDAVVQQFSDELHVFRNGLEALDTLKELLNVAGKA